MLVRDRIKELRRVPARELRPNPRNWRVHPLVQQEALRGVLAEIGFADALLARELADGSLELIDGHLRAETMSEQLVPVLVLDVSAEEATKILLTHDPLANLAETNQEHLTSLLAECSFSNPAVQAMLSELTLSEPNTPEGEEPRVLSVPESYQVVVTCRDEEDQRSVFERLSHEGYSCRLLML
jgi:hypothetical protein